MFVPLVTDNRIYAVVDQFHWDQTTMPSYTW